MTTMTIAISGKGGVGKTAVAALLIDELARRDAGRILAVDSDPAANLYQVLGAPVPTFIGNVREEAQAAAKSRVMHGRNPRAELEAAVQAALTRTPRFDLIAMGRPEGPGCYCVPNRIISRAITALEEGYDFVVVDTEAGMEHLSRQTAASLSYLVLVLDQTVRSARTALEAAQLVQTLGTPVGEVLFVLNRAPAAKGGIEQMPGVQLVQEQGYTLRFACPEDEALTTLDREGTPLTALPESSPFRLACRELLAYLLAAPQR